MPQRRRRHGVEVVEGNVVAAFEERANLPREDQCLHAAWAGAPADVALHAVELGAIGMAGRDQPSGVGQNMLGDRNLAGDALGVEDRLRVRHRLKLWRRFARGASRDLEQIVLTGEGNEHFEKEPVELRLWQRIRTLEFDRVLGGKHEEWSRQRSGLGPHRHGVLLHGFE